MKEKLNLLTDFSDRMIDAAQKEDIEAAHKEADDILCELLVDLGCKDIVKLYKNVPKWYC